MTADRSDEGSDPEEHRPFELSRRRFLGYTGAGGAALVLRDAFAFRALAGPPAVPPVTFTRTARRREDFLNLTFEFRNLVLDGSNPRRLVKSNPKQAAYLTVYFPPQHLSDEAKKHEDITDPPHDTEAPGAILSRLAGPSRLAFQVPDPLLPMTFDIQTLLSWVFFFIRVPVLGQDVPPPAQISAPGAAETAIELPWFLLLSPRSNAGWAHARVPVTRPSFAVGDRTELWHTRLGTRKPGFLNIPFVDEADPTDRTVRAVWAKDMNFPGVTPDPGPPFFSLNAGHRRDIVYLSSVVQNRRPIQVNRLMLSALGGWLDSRGDWDPPPEHAVEEWRHRATMGRDSYVRVVEQGFLMPFGHMAAKITISERQFHTVGTNPRGAYLVQRQFIVVRQRRKEYGALKALGQPDDGRGFPFRAVEITTLTTPDLDLNGSRIYFPVTEAGDDVVFDLIGIDWEGQPTEFSAPLMWVRKDAVFEVPQNTEQEEDEEAITAPNLSAVEAAYNEAQNSSKRKVAARGQKLAFAPAKKGGDTTLPVEELVFRAQVLAQDAYNDIKSVLEQAQQPPFYPLLEEAKVRMSAVGEMAGAVGELLGVQLDTGFIQNGLEGMFEDLEENANAALNNAGELFLSTIGDILPVEFGDPAKAGGLVTPNFDISALSRELGPVGGVLDDLRKGTFDPKTIFDIASAKLLGQLKLGDILKFIEDSHALGENGPRIQTLIDPKPPGIPKTVTTKLEWKPELVKEGDQQAGDPLGIFKADQTSELSITAQAVTDLVKPEDSTFSVEGLLRNITLNLIGPQTFITIEVKEVRFTVGKGQPPDVDPQLGEIHFTGALTFVEEMKNFLSSLGKGYGVDVQPTGIEASLTIPLPSISVGIFTMQNLSIGIGAIIPFTGDAARFRFSFCSREDPFILTVAMFGGGGFFALECGTDKSVMLEISLEFGAAVAFDIGVASGGVEIMAGIYIKVENDDALLSGFLRMGGELSILGIVRISMELYLGFEYHTKSRKCIGEARFFLEIEILFITIPVKATVRRAFGGEGDPTFAQLMSEDDWAEYCNAYAGLETA